MHQRYAELASPTTCHTDFAATGSCAAVLECHVANNEDDNMIVVPIPGDDNAEERRRIRESNDRDQEMEREGKRSKHNRGYDEAADGLTPPPEIERVVDE